MCEFSKRLVAWLDNELLEGESAEMEQHLAECVQCREQLDAYRQASDEFGAYCNAYGDTALSAKRSRTAVRTAGSVYGAAAIAAAVATFLLFTARTPQPQERGAVEIGSAASSSEAVATAQKGMSNAAAARRMEAPVTEENTGSLDGAAAVEIAIPADAIFPPGAVPAGVNFTADVTMASDGSAEQIRLRPQLTEFEKKGAQR